MYRFHRLISLNRYITRRRNSSRQVSAPRLVLSATHPVLLCATYPRGREKEGMKALGLCQFWRSDVARHFPVACTAHEKRPPHRKRRNSFFLISDRTRNIWSWSERSPQETSRPDVTPYSGNGACSTRSEKFLGRKSTTNRSPMSRMKVRPAPSGCLLTTSAQVLRKAVLNRRRGNALTTSSSVARGMMEGSAPSTSAPAPAETRNTSADLKAAYGEACNAMPSQTTLSFSGIACCDSRKRRAASAPSISKGLSPSNLEVRPKSCITQAR